MAYDLFSNANVVESPPLVNQSPEGYNLFGDNSQPAAPKTPVTWGGEFTTAFSRGAHELSSTFKGGAALASAWVGADSLSKYFLKGYNESISLAQQEPSTVDSVTDIDGMDHAIRYGLSTFGGLAPITLGQLGAGAIGSLAGTFTEPGGGTIAGGLIGLVSRKAVASLLKGGLEDAIDAGVNDELQSYVEGKVAKSALSKKAQALLTQQGESIAKHYGGTALTGFVNAVSMMGATYGELSQNPDIAESDKEWAASIGGLVASLPMTGVMSYVGKVFNPGMAEEALESDAGKKLVAEQAGFATRFMATGGKEIAKNMGHASAGMFLQTAITLAAKNWAENPNDRFAFLNYTPSQWQQMLDSTAQGAILGLGLGGLSGLRKTMTDYPDPQVRSDERDILQGADDVKIPTTPDQDELSAVQGKILDLHSQIESGVLQEDDLTNAQTELVGHQQRESELLEKLWPGPEPEATKTESEPLVNQKTEEKPASQEPKEEQKISVSPPDTDEAKIESLRAFYAQKMPTTATGEPVEIDAGDLADKRKEVDDHIDQIAGGTDYGKQLKAAFKPGEIAMMAAGHVVLDSKEGTGWRATIDNQGKIKIYVPTKSDGDDTQLAVNHEFIHAADLIGLRDQFQGQPGKLSDLVNQKFAERGANLRAAAPELPKLLKQAYERDLGNATDIQIGQELPRMAVEMGRLGTTTEVTQALQEGAQHSLKVNAFFRDWIDALKNIGGVIKRFLNPSSANPDLVKAYNDINSTLDKFGAVKDEPLVNQKSEPLPSAPNVPLSAASETQAKEATPLSEKAPSNKQQAHRAFQAAIHESPSAAARAHIAWQAARGEMPHSQAEIRAAHQDFLKRAPRATVNLQRYQDLVKESIRNEQKEKEPVQVAESQPAQKAEPNAPGIFDSERDRDLYGPARSITEYSHPIVKGAAEAAKSAAPGGRIDAARQYLTKHAPELVPHFDNIQEQLKSGKMDTVAQARLKMQPMPLRGPEVADNVKGTDNVMFFRFPIPDLTKKLLEERGIHAMGPDDEYPADRWVIDTSGLLEGHDLVNQNASVKMPVEVTDKLTEAQLTHGIPETHAIMALDMGTVNTNSVQKFNEIFGEGQWILKSFARDAAQGVGIMKASDVEHLLRNDPNIFDHYDTDELMVQRLHDINPPTNQGFRQAGQELRVHVMTDQDGQAHIVPFSTYRALTVDEAQQTPYDMRTPYVVEDADIRNAHDQALQSIQSLPEADRSGQFFGLDMVRLRDGGWGTVENNPTGEEGQSGFFALSPLAHDSYIASILGEHPIHAELANLAQEHMVTDSEPLVNQNGQPQESIPAQKPKFTPEQDRKLEDVARKVNGEFGRSFDEMRTGKVRSENRGQASDYESMTPQATEYASNPQSDAMRIAHSLITNHGLMNVIDALKSDPLAIQYHLDENGAPVTDAWSALNGEVLQQIDSIRTALGRTSGDRQVKMWLDDSFRQLEKGYNNILTASGQAGSIVGKVSRVYNAANMRRAFTDAILSHLDTVLGKKGAGIVKNMAEALNGLVAQYADRAVTRAETIAQLQKILEASHTRKYQQELRKTYVATDARAKDVVKTAAARMAEHQGMDEKGTEWANEAANRIAKKMNGLPVQSGAKTERELLNSAIQQVATDNAKELGLIPEGEKPTLEQKFTAILKNEALYREFSSTLHQKMLEKYKPEPGSLFADQVEQFRGEMANRAWSQGMIDSLVNQKLRENSIKLSKLAQDHYGKTDASVEQLKESVRKTMASSGVVNEGLLDKLVDDIEGSMRSRVEQARLDFFGSNRGIGAMLKHMQSSLAEKARDNALAKTDLPEKLHEWLAEDFGIPDTKEMPLASALHDVMMRQYGDMLGDKRRQIVENMVSKATAEAKPKIRTAGQRSIDRVLQLANLGVMRDETAYKALSKPFGLPDYNEEVAQQIQKLGDAIATAPNERESDALKQVLTQLIASQKGVRPYDMFVAGLYTNFLSGPSTGLTHVTGNSSSLLGSLAVNAVQYPSRIPQMFRALLRTAMGSAQIEAREAFFSGHVLYRTGNKFFRGDNPLEMSNPVFKSDIDLGNDKLNAQFRSAAEAIAKFEHKVYTGLGAKYIGRYLNAADAFFYKMAQESAFVAKTGITETPEMRGSAMDEARKQMASIGENPNDSRELLRKQQIYANQILNQWRLVNQKGEIDPDLQEAWQASHNEAMDTTFKQKPKGILGQFSKLLESWARGRDGQDNVIGKILIPFTRIAANVTNQMLEWTPYGLARWAGIEPFGRDFLLKDTEGNTLGRDPKIAIRAFLGAAAGMGLYALFAQHHDDKDPYIAVYDDGSANPERRRQMMDMGWRPHTLKVGNTYYNYTTTPFSMVFSILGRMFDNIRDGHQDENGIASSAVAMLQTIKHQSFLSSMTDFMAAVDSPNPDAAMSRLMARSTSSIFIPNLAQQVDKWVDPSIQQAQGFTENFIKNIPVVRESLKPSLNIFGEPLKHEPAIDLPGTEKFLTMQKTDDPVYNYLSEANVTVPGFSKSSKLGNQVMTREQYYDYVSTAGPLLKKAIQADIPQLQGMTKEQAQERINELARQLKERVRNQMRPIVPLSQYTPPTNPTFTSPREVREAFQSGQIDRDTAIVQLNENFGLSS